MGRNKKNRGRGRGGGPGGRGFQQHDQRVPAGAPAIIKRSENLKMRGRGRGRGGAQAFTPTHPSARKDKRRKGADKTPFTQVVEEVPEDAIIRHQNLPKAHLDAVMAITITADRVYTASRDKMLKKWKVETDPQTGRFKLEPELSVELGDQCLCLLSVQDWLFCGMGTGRIKGFKPGREIMVEGHEKRCSSLILHENVLISGGSDACIKLWSMDVAAQTINCTHSISEGLPGPINSMCVLGAHLWVGGASGIGIVELATLKVVHQLPPKKFVAGLLPFEGHMIVMYLDGSAGIFDAGGAQKLANPPMPAGPVLCMAGLAVAASPAAPGFARVLCGHAKGHISSVTLPMFETKKYWQALERCKVQCMTCVGEGGIFITGAENGALQLWQKNPASS